jgi:hypothetical protein
MSIPKGELVELDVFRTQKAEQEELERREKEREELELTLHEMTRLKHILEQITENLDGSRPGD